MVVSHAVAACLRDYQRVQLAAVSARAQTTFPRTVHWQPTSLAQGDAGMALICACLDACFPDQEWDRIGHRYLTTAAQGAEQAPFQSSGMFSGLAGLAFSALSLSRGGSRYRRLLTVLNDALLPQIEAQAKNLKRHGNDGLSFGSFDVISGLAGAGAYLLAYHSSRGDDAAVLAATEGVLDALVALSGDSGGLPRWWTPPHLLGDEEAAALHPYGNLNCGLAHGIPGPLALMALALSSGTVVSGLEEAIDRLAEWLMGYRAPDRWGVNWPYAVPLTRDGVPDRAAASRTPGRAAWCYGAPGAARALWLAGVARQRSEWRNIAVEAMQAVYRRPVAARNIDSPTLCHGVAGLLQITLRFAHDTRLPVFTEAAADLFEWLCGAYEPDSLLGYRNWEPGGTRVDQPGLLDGAPGVLLTLLAACTDVEPSWDRAFLLA
jgi:lantibiotic biosynthesis protein